MILNIKARFSDGVLTPLEPLDLENGTEVTLHIENNSSQEALAEIPRERPPSGSDTHPLNKLVDELWESLPESGRREMESEAPTDGAANYKHYLYGWPKENE